MKTEIQTTNNFTPEQLQLIKNTISKDATPDELKLFLYRAQNLGLDPLKPGQIHFIKYGNSPGTIVIGIDGFRTRAAKSGKLSGIKRGALKDDKGKLIGAWAEIYRSDWKECAREEVSLSEYSTGKNLWLKMPETMIKKVAEAAALRMAFPDDLGGIYTNEEMDQAAAQGERIIPQQPGPEDHTPAEYTKFGLPYEDEVMSEGKYTGRTYGQVGPSALADMVEAMEQAGPKLSPTQVIRKNRAIAYVTAYENKMAKNMRDGEVIEPSDADESVLGFENETATLFTTNPPMSGVKR